RRREIPGVYADHRPGPEHDARDRDERSEILDPSVHGELPLCGQAAGRLPKPGHGLEHRKGRRYARPRRRLPEDRRCEMSRKSILAFGALLMLSSTAQASMFDSNGYPSKGRAIDTFKPASDYSDVLKGRPLALGIMRTRGQGFVPSRELHDYARGVMMRLLSGVTLPPSFQPDVHILATPEFAGECTPARTLIITIGLMAQLQPHTDFTIT